MLYLLCMMLIRSNVVSVAEHVIMTLLVLVRNFVPAHEQVMRGEWNVAAVARDSYDLEGKVIGTLGAGRIGFRVLQRLLPFNPKKLLYYDYQPLPAAAEKEVGAERVQDLKEFLGQLGMSWSLFPSFPLYSTLSNG